MKPCLIAFCVALLPVVATANTIVYYHFDGTNGQAAGTIHDSSTNGFDGVVQGTAVYASGPSGTCLDLTGDYNYVSIPAGETLILSNSWTVELLFRMNVPYVNDGSDPAVLFNKLNTPYVGDYLDSFCIQLGSSGVLSAQIGFGNLSGQYLSSSQGNYSDGNWHHAALVYSVNPATGTNIAMLYADYALVSVVSSSFPPVVWESYPINIGAGNYPGNYPGSGYRRNMDGQVDEFRVSDVALTPDQFVSLPQGRPAPLTIQAVPGGVSLNFGSVTNETYQLKSLINLGTDPWEDFGGPIAGTGAQVSVPDGYVDGRVQRFYKLLMTP